MTLLPPNVKVHLAYGYTDMRKGMDGLALLVQEVLQQAPFSGHLFVFRGRRANLIKVVFWDGTGLCLFTKRLEDGGFLWPPNIEPGRTLALTSTQLSALLEGIDWGSWSVGTYYVTRDEVERIGIREKRHENASRGCQNDLNESSGNPKGRSA